MNKLFIRLVTVCIVLCLHSCINKISNKAIESQKEAEYNEQQIEFCNQLKSCIASYRGRANDTQISNIDKVFENYLDSVGLFIGWKGVISDIKAETVMGHPSFYYEIKFSIPYYTTVTMKGYNYMDSQKEVQESYVFNKIKNIRNGTIVYFDGVITRDNDGKVRYGIMDDEKRFTSPGYDFIATDIYTSKPDSLSNQLKEANAKSRAAVLYTRKMINKEISEKQWDKKMKQIGKVNLSDKKEELYNKRYSEALMRYMW